MYRHFFKRMLDIVFSLMGIIVLLPILTIITVILFFANEGKPFFFQCRPGRKEEIFTVIKFKTMNDRKDQNGNFLPDIARLTSIGKFLRKTSLDEIPQLINVIIGDMSLIGPRPLLIKYLPLYNDEQQRRHEIRPGITGWAQVNGRNAISWVEKLHLDVWYVDHVSFWLDTKIFLLTMKKVVLTEGINAKANIPTNTKHMSTPS